MRTRMGRSKRDDVDAMVFFVLFEKAKQLDTLVAVYVLASCGLVCYLFYFNVG